MPKGGGDSRQGRSGARAFSPAIFFVRFFRAVLFGCLLLAPLAGLPAQSDEYDREESISRYTSRILHSWGRSPEEIAQTLGAPLEKTPEHDTNAHPPDVAGRVVTLSYTDLEISVFTGDTAHGGTNVVALICSSAQYRLKHLNVGDRIDKLRRELGKPDEAGKGYVYYESTYAELTVTHDRNGVITRIEGYLSMD